MVCEKGQKDDAPKEVTKVLLIQEEEHCRVYKEIKTNGKVVTCQLDIGSDVHLMSYDVYREIGSPTMDQGPRALCWMSEEDQMMTTGSLVLDTEIDGEVYELRLHVVRRKDFKVIIGNGMLKNAAIAIEGSDALFKKLPNNEKNIVYCVQIVNFATGECIQSPFRECQGKD